VSAAGERISDKSCLARACRYVIYDDAVGVDAAKSIAWISAVLGYTAEMIRTVGIEETFRLASSSIWVSDIRRDAVTPSHAVDI
jgi:hypothetical protein